MTTTAVEGARPADAATDAGGRRARLASGADRLSAGRTSLARHPQLLVGVAGAVMVTGILVIVLGWAGASRSTILEEQVPYLISGGLLGVALSTIGALLLFSHWLTVGIREARQREAARQTDHAELMEVLRALAGTDGHERNGDGAGDGGPRSTQPARPVRRSPRRP